MLLYFYFFFNMFVLILSVGIISDIRATMYSTSNIGKLEEKKWVEI